MRVLGPQSLLLQLLGLVLGEAECLGGPGGLLLVPILDTLDGEAFPLHRARRADVLVREQPALEQGTYFPTEIIITTK